MTLEQRGESYGSMAVVQQIAPLREAVSAWQRAAAWFGSVRLIDNVPVPVAA